MTAKEKITKARTGLILDRPFFGSLALRLKLVEDTTCKTAWTDGKHMGYDPAYIESLTLNQCKGLIAHEVMHNALAHHLRKGAREHSKWNLAADYAIDPLLVDDGMDVPDATIDPAWKDKSAEDIYNQIPDQKGDGNGNGQPQGGCGEVRQATNDDGSQLTQSQIQQQEQQAKVAVIQAAQQEKSLKAGKLSAGVQRLVDEILEPKVDWKTILRIFVDQSARNDYNFTQPNRRYLQSGFILPSLKSEELKPVVIAIDTSGSISKDDVNQFAAEISEILQEHQTSCTVIYCDTHITNVEEFSSDDLPLQLNPKGGGGTSFKPPFKFVEEQKLDPSCLIYLTDLCSSQFPEEPDYPVLWAQTGNYSKDIPFGEVISL